MTLPLSKTLDPADDEELAPELSLVDKYFTKAREQHPMRRWEYALALRALTTWRFTAQWRFTAHRTEEVAYDVGGGGSPFYLMQGALVVDPLEVPRGHQQLSLADFLSTRPFLADAVFCLSVLEHVDDLDRFLYHLSCLVAPSGLLFLTVDYCNDLSAYAYPEDTFHFHWMRKRIFNAYALGQSVTYPLLCRDFSHLDSVDLTWHGPQVYDYSFASLALVKRR